jgi:hypothetical protein
MNKSFNGDGNDNYIQNNENEKVINDFLDGEY